MPFIRCRKVPPTIRLVLPATGSDALKAGNHRSFCTFTSRVPRARGVRVLARVRPDPSDSETPLIGTLTTVR